MCACGTSHFLARFSEPDSLLRRRTIYLTITTVHLLQPHWHATQTDFTKPDFLPRRRTIYLTIMSALDFEEAGHKLLKMVG